MSEAAIKAEMRLWTLEAFVCECFSLWCVQQDKPGAIYVDFRRRMKKAATERTFEGFDPAMSDHLSAELEAAVGRLMDIGRQQLKGHLTPSQFQEFVDAMERDGGA